MTALGKTNESKPQKGDESGGNGKLKIENGKLGDEDGVDGVGNGKLRMENGKLGDAKDAKDEKDENGADVGVDGDAGDAGSAVEDPSAALKAEARAERDRYLRLAAEYDNYRKRSAKEREKTYGDARIDTISRLLPVYDNLERALKMECADEAFYKGIELTMTQLTEILENMDVERIAAVGEKFDPNRHNAVMTIENPELGEKTVAEEFQKGFALGDRVIRFSTVVVAN